jgi:ElaB/YqjD/DUF883 family membrane-anchored ribosome-binding protein
VPTREKRKLQSGIRALQNDLSSLVGDLEQIAATGRDAGVEKARDQLDKIQEQFHDLLTDSVGTAKQAASDTGDAVRKSVAENPMASVATAFAAGVAAAMLTMRR